MVILFVAISGCVYKGSEKPHPCKNRKEETPNFKGKRTAPMRSLRMTPPIRPPTQIPLAYRGEFVYAPLGNRYE